MKICDAGLFVGAEHYASLSKKDQPTGACLGAQQLRDYFLRSAPDRPWDLLTTSDNAKANRTTVISRFVESVQSNRTCDFFLFYFAGHGVIAEEGLILAAEDYHPSAPFDSGVPLQRLLDLIGLHGSNTTRYLLVLDTCRIGVLDSLPPRIPDNVCLVYACRANQKTLQIGGVSEFLQALLTALRSVPRQKVGQRSVLAFNALCQVLESGSTRYRVNVASQIEIKNRFQECIYLPALDEATQPSVEVTTAFPDVQLETATFRRTFILEARNKVRSALAEWAGFEATDQVTKIVTVRPTAGRGHDAFLQVSLSRPTMTDSRRGLIEYVLTRSPNVFWKLVLTWPNPIGSYWCDAIGNAFDLQIQHLPTPDSVVLHWMHDDASGQIYSSPNANGTHGIMITARSATGNPWALQRLGERFFDIYQSLCVAGVPKH